MDGGSDSAGQDRPPVSVILPFFGTLEEGRAALAALGVLELRGDDELLVADNTPDGVLAATGGGFACAVRRSAYAARNEAAERAVNDWLLFLDADCRPRADLLDRYFDPAPAAGTGAVAGEVLGLAGQPGWVPRYIRSRRHLDQAWLQEHPYRPMAVTANLLVRREAFEGVGGFAEATRSGADAELCWRLQDEGWALEYRADASVEHEHRASLRALVSQTTRDGAGGRWLARRHPGFRAHPSLAGELARLLAGVPYHLLRRDPEAAAFRAVDALHTVAAAAGSLQSNGAPREPAPGRVAFLTEFPAQAPEDAAVEALRRPVRGDWRRWRTTPAWWSEDDGALARGRALAVLGRRRPRALLDALRAHGPARVAALAPAASRLERDSLVLAAPDRVRDAALAAELAGAPAPTVVVAEREAATA